MTYCPPFFMSVNVYVMYLDLLKLLLFGKVTEGMLEEENREYSACVHVDGNSRPLDKRQDKKRIERKRPAVSKEVAMDDEEVRHRVEDWTSQLSHLKGDSSLAEVAAQIGISQKTFSKYLSLHLNIGFRTWRTRCRIEMASRLLLEREGATVEEISRAVGMLNKSNFYRRFKQFMGCTPQQWRDCNGQLRLLD